YPTPWPVITRTEKINPIAYFVSIMFAMPGEYKASLSMVTRDSANELVAPVSFTTKLLNISTLPAEDYQEVVDFQLKARKLGSAMDGTQRFAADLQKKIILIKQTLNKTPGVPAELMVKAREIEIALEDIQFRFEGRKAVASWEEIPPSPMPFNQRLQWLISTRMGSTSGITQTEIDAYNILNEEFPPVMEELKAINKKVTQLNEKLDEAGAPWKLGRTPVWQ
ncbi:MAG: hypothetical protein KAT15_18695, partial [Bacteroidales bacterium]|nr:hypothetical protein [Bacteroidales bacterium]